MKTFVLLLVMAFPCVAVGDMQPTQAPTQAPVQKPVQKPTQNVVQKGETVAFFKGRWRARRGQRMGRVRGMFGRACSRCG